MLLCEMRFVLSKNQLGALILVENLILEAETAQHENARTPCMRAAAYAYALNLDLELSGVVFTFDEQLVKNRGMSSKNPHFFEHIVSLQSFRDKIYNLRHPNSDCYIP